MNEHHHTQAALQEALGRLEATLNALPDLLFEVDQAGHIYGYRAPAPDWLYVPPGAFLGRTVAEVTPPESAAAIMAAIQEATTQGSSFGRSYQLPMPDGPHWYELSVAVQGDAGKTDKRLVVLVRDISQRKRAEEALREREAELMEAQRVANIGSYVLNITTGIWTSSAVLDDIFGIDASYARTVENWALLVHPDDRALMLDYFLSEVLGKQTPFDREYRIARRRDNATRWVHGRGRLRFDQQGAPIAMLGTIQDITERKHAEQEQELLQAQLVQAQKMESIGRLAGGVAHDFNNMLTVILGRSEAVLSRAPLDQTLRADIEEILKAALRSADLTRQLLAFARKQPIAPQVLDLNETVASMLKLLNRLIGEDIRLLWQPGTDLWPVKVDPSQIHQILVNLCVNARDAITGAGVIAITTGNRAIDAAACAADPHLAPGEFVRLAVKDEGHGMDEATLAHIFEPFFTTKSSGTGLGLSTVYGAVKQHDGFVTVDSAPGYGTTFTVYLPRHQGAPAPVHPPTPAAPLTRAAATILVVEDEPAILAASVEALELYGYHVLAAGTPAGALRVAAEHDGEIHLLITDFSLPGMNGRELARQLWAQRPQLRCLYTSGHSEDAIAGDGAPPGMTAFLQKPYSGDQLAAQAQALLNARA